MARKLHIAVSVFFGVVTVVLCVLWVRSGIFFVRGHFPGVPSFSVMSYRFDEPDLPNGAVTAYVCFGLTPDPEAVWDIGRISFLSGGIPEGFDFKIDFGTNVWLQAPHWFLSVLCGTVAAIFLFVPRFSLRTLLVATTLVAVVLGLVVWMVK